jgi:arabinogalactan endo-1,4-beta-galactosidase
VPGVVVGADGVVGIAAEFSLSAGAWGVLDEVRLVAPESSATPVGTAGLDAALARATAADRSKFTAASLADLDDAVAIGEVVLAGSRATARDVKDATKLVEKAVQQLKRLKQQ